jgi:putative transposase
MARIGGLIAKRNSLACAACHGETMGMLAHDRKCCKRYDIPGDAHALTFSCFKRLPLFSHERTCQWTLDALGQGRTKGLFDLWAYVIMPEHVHLVVLPHPDVKISIILKSLKQSVANHALSWLENNAPQFLRTLEDVQPNGDRAHRFWQRGGGYDRNLRSVDDIHEKINYVHNNPVRRGLVDRASSWRWSSCRAWETGEDTPIAIDRASLPAKIVLA